MINSYEKIVSSIETNLKDYFVDETKHYITNKNKKHCYVWHDSDHFYIRIEQNNRIEFYGYSVAKGCRSYIKNICDVLNTNIKSTININNYSMSDLIIKHSIFQGVAKWIFSGKNDEFLEEHVYPFVNIIKKLVWETYESQCITKIIAFYNSDDFSNSTNEMIVDFLKSKYAYPLAKYDHSAILVDKNSFIVKEYIGHSTCSIQNIEEYNIPIEYVLTINNIRLNHISPKDNDIIYFILDDKGEILIVNDKRLLFTIKGNDCRPFHFEFFKDKLYVYLGTIADKAPIIINSLIDVSFARTGGLLCILENDTEIVNVLKIVKDRGCGHFFRLII